MRKKTVQTNSTKSSTKGNAKSNTKSNAKSNTKSNARNIRSLYKGLGNTYT